VTPMSRRTPANVEWFPALVGVTWSAQPPYYEHHSTVVVSDRASAAERARVYKALLEIKWLSSEVRSAVLMELGGSVRQQRKDYKKGQAFVLKKLVDEEKARMRANRERPHGGVHDAAVVTVAEAQGMTVANLKKTISRYGPKAEGRRGRVR
jgi:hypothetical protein